MKIYILLIYVMIIGCKENQSKEIKTHIKKEYQMKKNINISKFEDIMQIEKEEAIRKYGNPFKQEISKLNDMQGEFWEGLEEKFTEEEKKREIIIHELTWEKDSINFITVWYKKSPNRLITRDFYIWNKELEF